jgi:hypothetical protein
MFLACLDQDGHGIRMLGVRTDASGPSANLSFCITGAAEQHLTELMLAAASEEWTYLTLAPCFQCQWLCFRKTLHYHG